MDERRSYPAKPFTSPTEGAVAPEIGVPDPEQRAQVVLMLLDGAVVHSVIRGNGDPLREARAALPGLISAP